MKKAICVLGCVIALTLAGCQMLLDPPNGETDSNRTIEHSTPDPGGASGSDPVPTDAVPNYTDPGTDAPPGDDPVGTPALPGEIHGNADQLEYFPFDSVTILEWVEERVLKDEGSLRGELEAAHKLPIGKRDLSEGDTVLFHIETKSDEAELKITLTGAGTGTVLEGSVTEASELSFEIDIADEYSVVLENRGRGAVQFTIDYSIGGSK